MPERAEFIHSTVILAINNLFQMKTKICTMNSTPINLTITNDFIVQINLNLLEICGIHVPLFHKSERPGCCYFKWEGSLQPIRCHIPLE